MKKLIGALALAAMVAASAFAEVSFGGWVRTLPTYVGSNGEDIKTGALSASWGGPFWARFDSSWTSDDGKAGLNMRLNADKGGVGTHDDVGIWLKPIDQIYVQVGALWNFAGLRGDMCYGSWNWLRPTNCWLIEDEGLTFNPGSAHGKQGVGINIVSTDELSLDFSDAVDCVHSSNPALSEYLVQCLDVSIKRNKAENLQGFYRSDFQSR